VQGHQMKSWMKSCASSHFALLSIIGATAALRTAVKRNQTGMGFAIWVAAFSLLVESSSPNGLLFEPLEISLDGNDWKLASIGGEAIVLTNATVPGGVWDNLHKSGRIGDPLYRNNDIVFANITTNPYGRREWVFTKSFSFPSVRILSVLRRRTI
jgi:hypothetical protein